TIGAPACRAEEDVAEHEVAHPRAFSVSRLSGSRGAVMVGHGLPGAASMWSGSSSALMIRAMPGSSFLTEARIAAARTSSTPISRGSVGGAGAVVASAAGGDVIVTHGAG